MILAIVPAAGLSTRMGQPKLLLPFNGQPIIQHVIAALREGGVDRVLVVAGPHVPQLPLAAALAGADVCLLKEPTPDMRATVERGFRWLKEIVQPKSSDVWFLAPADHPTLNSEVVRQMIDAAKESDRSIVIPVYQGKRGHPTLLSWRHVKDIESLPADRGINTFLRANVSETLEMPVVDSEVLADLDTPEDLERIRTIAGKSPSR